MSAWSLTWAHWVLHNNTRLLIVFIWKLQLKSRTLRDGRRCLDNRAPIWPLFAVPSQNLARASNNIHTSLRGRTDCSLNKWNFLLFGPQLNMSNCLFFSHLEAAQKGTELRAVTSEVPGISADAFLRFFFLLLLSGLKRGLSRSQHCTLASTTLFSCWRLDTSSTRRLSSGKWVSNKTWTSDSPKSAVFFSSVPRYCLVS